MLYAFVFYGIAIAMLILAWTHENIVMIATIMLGIGLLIGSNYKRH